MSMQPMPYHRSYKREDSTEHHQNDIITYQCCFIELGAGPNKMTKHQVTRHRAPPKRQTKKRLNTITSLYPKCIKMVLRQHEAPEVV